MADVLDNAAIRKRVGDRLLAARTIDGRTLRDIADAITATGHRVSPQAISMWERGETMPTPAMQAAVADVLAAPWSELFDPATDEVAS